jgi:serine/threonine protein phosphatase 1
VTAIRYSGRCIAIGDIHGCAEALRAILHAIDAQPADLVVVLGDIIDRGPNSRNAVEQLLELRQRCQLKVVMGNHEEMFLAVMRGKSAPHKWVQFGGASTLDSYGFDGDLAVVPQEHVEFLSSFDDYIEIDKYFFVHANYEARVPLAEQKSSWLRWRSLDEVMPAPHCSGKIAVVGHTAETSGEILSMRHLKCIDTYCYGGKWLTALDVDAGQCWQANDQGELRSATTA